MYLCPEMRSGRFDYTINVGTMLQTNVQTGTTRRLRRVRILHEPEAQITAKCLSVMHELVPWHWRVIVLCRRGGGHSERD